MTSKVILALHQYESLVEKGSIPSFSVFIQDKGILIQPAGSEAGKEIMLLQELLSCLRAFFFGVAAIEHNSFDYATLKSFIHASVHEGKMAS